MHASVSWCVGTALKQIQYIDKGGGGGGGRTPVACEAHIQGGKSWGIPQKKIGILDPITSV